ncbi:MAG: tRNA preQ1(34) S-adenosylmethionine ribosyltransferase-isomerase QueA [Verrucomicrobiota bacterium]
MKVSHFDYTLPEHLIASHPTPHRDGSRLMVLHRSSGKIEHRLFSQISDYLKPTDLLVLNNSKVIPSRLSSRGNEFEVLLIEETSPSHWIALMKPGRKAPIGKIIDFDPHPDFQKQGVAPIRAEVLRVLPQGERVLRFFGELRLEAFGEIPLPPYIIKKRESESQSRIHADDPDRYQTVYAQNPGSVAAPTAGLHFTSGLLARYPHAFVTLHVGIGTFRPVKTELLESHKMHEEWFEIPSDLQEKAKKAERIVAVGTTSVRVLESASSLSAQTGRTDIFIYPPYEFKRVDLLVTNFHLPKSTLLMLVSAFGGMDLIRHAYEEAIREEYRFFSYGDAMLIL